MLHVLTIGSTRGQTADLLLKSAMANHNRRCYSCRCFDAKVQEKGGRPMIGRWIPLIQFYQVDAPCNMPR